MTTNLKKLGGSLVAVIPKDIVDDLNLTAEMPMTIISSGGKVVIERKGRRSRRSMKEIVAQINPANYRRKRDVLEDGGPVGKEFW